MNHDDSSSKVPTEDLLGLGVKDSPPAVRLRVQEDKSDRRSKGIVFGDDFQVSPEQEETDHELVKQVYTGI